MVIALILWISNVREKLPNIGGLLNMRSSLYSNGSVGKDLHNAIGPMCFALKLSWVILYHLGQVVDFIFIIDAFSVGSQKVLIDKGLSSMMYCCEACYERNVDQHISVESCCSWKTGNQANEFFHPPHMLTDGLILMLDVCEFSAAE